MYESISAAWQTDYLGYCTQRLVEICRIKQNVVGRLFDPIIPGRDQNLLPSLHKNGKRERIGGWKRLAEFLNRFRPTTEAKKLAGINAPENPHSRRPCYWRSTTLRQAPQVLNYDYHGSSSFMGER